MFCTTVDYNTMYIKKSMYMYMYIKKSTLAELRVRVDPENLSPWVVWGQEMIWTENNSNHGLFHTMSILNSKKSEKNTFFVN